jgi:hypothetical protein
MKDLQIILGLIGVYLAGWFSTRQNYRDAVRDRGEMGLAYGLLVEENRRLTGEVFALRQAVIDVSSQLAISLSQIAELSSRISDET